MNIKRRTFLVGSGAAMILPDCALASPMVLRAQPVSAQILPVGDNPTAMLGFNGSSPGPELRFRQGSTANIRFTNQTNEGSSIHWHGIRLNNTMDGVPGLTQKLIEPNESFDYAFQLPDAGTFWYHAHHRSWEQVAKGLYGPLIVTEHNPPQVDRDITVLLDDWRIDDTGALMGGFGNRHDFAHAGRMGKLCQNNAVPGQSSPW